MSKTTKIIISGGGTGGHIFPAISIANALKKIDSSIEILFVGAKNRMEMEKIPAAGYKIVGLPIIGLQRKFSLKNIVVVVKLLLSLIKSKKILKKFEADVAVGVGGYASGAVVYVASHLGIPTLLQEQNSYPGITNKLLSKKADKICVAYNSMDKYFPAQKIVLTGNPIRQNVLNNKIDRIEALKYFGLKPNKKTLLIIGGSLGAKTINDSISSFIEKIGKSEIQMIWQTGQYYFNEVEEFVTPFSFENICVTKFISRMDYAFSIADLVISRAGAGTISELCVLEKPTIFVPSPNVTEDHQTKNAQAIVDLDGAILIIDREAEQKLVDVAFKLIYDEEKLKSLSENIAKMALRNSDEIIAKEVLKLCKTTK
ncbi:MAG: undecaprenyldiphospho-muramoylpentapeptide beta-N-acetylglucosaminyltransferase [Bacteroidetes bacterium]|jgi:UDP-N-acetylglucosamine--N-acetylmuramyl-(pentapeptide) pyrophosphoryl-undecaprenol N-acetylglucosamine transferase|nr:undecaprenyldiphospho-muramoylpentapeptide beta-N-acetylglucosaminyltransferase [Bacteroidota bacterium]MBT6684736.1 undecaprenyldiphospho-muramoylpentapeptide beta-N-acetylglucosaminyltransferase [Bacteroidota bacterium]MBT7143837.1 undecaprenyldiphospho-muramoylpentapeptide beta-N-acetylglucosaminyltransferase [Bacteroidota bacterium]MBT7489982.1 undecaprenyldiphospho-muramoylpentapeptide beta-N-acetylglucosaminyltransferase [Bacteroidota bacterium]